MGKIVAVSIRLDEELLDRAKVEAIVRGVTLGEIVNEALRKELSSSQGQQMSSNVMKKADATLAVEAIFSRIIRSGIDPCNGSWKQ